MVQTTSTLSGSSTAELSGVDAHKLIKMTTRGRLLNGIRARRLRFARGLWLPLLLVAFGGLVAAWAQPQKQVYILAAAAVLVAQSFLIAGLLLQRRMRRQAEDHVRRDEEALRGSSERIRHLGARLLQAQDSERSRIARELHDDISQQVAVLSIDLELLLGAVPPDTEPLADEALHRAHDLARSVHELSHRLHPSKLRLIGLVSALQALQRELSRSDTTVAFTHGGVPANLPLDLTLSVFRVAQEAVQNALKHGRARTVTVDLRGGSNVLALTVSDDGVGFDVDAVWGEGLGLISMGERIEAIEGTLDIRSTPGGGTCLTIAVPLPEERAAEVTSAEQLG